MPTYDYVCRGCGHEFEEFQSITAPVKRKCPECGKPKLERLIGTGAGILFKGGGFYETDYRSEGYKQAAEAEKKAAEPASDANADSKQKKSDTPEKKPEQPAKSSPAESKPARKPVAKVKTKSSSAARSRKPK